MHDMHKCNDIITITTIFWDIAQHLYLQHVRTCVYLHLYVCVCIYVHVCVYMIVGTYLHVWTLALLLSVQSFHDF